MRSAVVSPVVNANMCACGRRWMLRSVAQQQHRARRLSSRASRRVHSTSRNLFRPWINFYHKGQKPPPPPLYAPPSILYPSIGFPYAATAQTQLPVCGVCPNTAALQVRVCACVMGTVLSKHPCDARRAFCTHSSKECTQQRGGNRALLRCLRGFLTIPQHVSCTC